MFSAGFYCAKICEKLMSYYDSQAKTFFTKVAEIRVLATQWSRTCDVFDFVCRLFHKSVTFFTQKYH